MFSVFVPRRPQLLLHRLSDTHFPAVLLTVGLHNPNEASQVSISGCDFSSATINVAQLVKESACSTGDLGSIPGSRRSPGEGNGNPLRYSSLENPMDRGTW